MKVKSREKMKRTIAGLLVGVMSIGLVFSNVSGRINVRASSVDSQMESGRAIQPELSKDQWTKVGDVWKKIVYFELLDFEKKNVGEKITIASGAGQGPSMPAQGTIGANKGGFEGEIISVGANNKALKINNTAFGNLYSKYDLSTAVPADYYELKIKTSAQQVMSPPKALGVKLGNANAYIWSNEGKISYYKADGTLISEQEGTPAEFRSLPAEATSGSSVDGIISGIKASSKTEVSLTIEVPGDRANNYYIDQLEFIAVTKTDPNPVTPPGPEKPTEDPYPVGIDKWEKSDKDQKWRKKVTVPMFDFEAGDYPYENETTLTTKQWTDSDLEANTKLYDKTGPTPVKTIAYGAAGNKALQAVLAKNSNVYGVVDLDALGAEGDSFELRAEYEKIKGQVTDLKLMSPNPGPDALLGGIYEYRGADGQKLKDDEIITGVNNGSPIITLANMANINGETNIKGAICGITEKKFVVRIQAGSGIDAKFDKIEIVAVKDINPDLPPVDPDPDPDPDPAPVDPKYPVGTNSWLKGEDSKFRKKVVVPIFDIQSPDYFGAKHLLSSSKFPQLSEFVSNTTLYEKDNETTVGLVNTGNKKSLEVIPTETAKESNLFAMVDLSAESADSYEIDVDYIKTAATPDTVVKLLDPKNFTQPLLGTYTYLDAKGEKIMNADNTILEKGEPAIQLAGGVATNTVTEVKGRICGITSGKFLVNIYSEAGSQGIKVHNIELIAVKNVDPSGGGSTGGGNTGGGSTGGSGGGVPTTGGTTKPSEDAILLNSDENITKAVSQIKEAEPKERLVIDMTTGNTKVPVELLSAAKGKDVTLQFEQNGIIAYVNGMSISELPFGIETYDIKITKSSNEGIGKIEDENVIEQLNCAFNGKLPFAVKTKSTVEKNQSGKMLYYNYYNEELDRYEYQSVDDVDSNGVLYGELNYGGKYIISSTPGYVPVKIESMKGTTNQRVNGKNNVVLKLTISPGDYTVKRIQWKVSDPAYATVGNNGVVRATKAGKGKEITVIASALDGSGLTKTFKVDLTPKKK